MVEKLSSQMSPRSVIEESNKTMDFASCLERLLLGDRCRRLGWEDEEVYITIWNEQVMIYKTDDKKVHPMIVSTGDIVGMDWVVVGKKENLS